MKALEILKNGVKFMEDAIEKNLASVMNINEEIKQYEEAIAELEEMLNPKTCEGCKWKSNPNLHNAFCGNCSRAVHLKDNYKPK